MVHFSYKGGCGICEHKYIEVFKRKAGLGYMVQLKGNLIPARVLQVEYCQVKITS